MKKSKISKNQERNEKYQNDCPHNVYSLVALKCDQASNVNDNQMLFL
jgi:hypothetical protein